MNRPETVNILGKIHTITYCDKMSDVDIYKRTAILGQFDYNTSTIRIYANQHETAIFQTLLHEIIHAITYDLHLKTITDADDVEDVVDMLALAIADLFTRNDWMK